MPAGKAAAAAAKAAVKEVSKAATTKPTKVVALAKLQPVSSTLKNFLGGVSETNRAESVKQLWSYIKTHRLQDPADGKQIICDEKLKLVLGKDRVTFTEIPGLLNSHFPPKETKKKS
jgi:upstream activation factor subunit UAF30